MNIKRYKPISFAIEELKNKKISERLPTGFNKLNNLLYGGLDFNRILAICGLSGHGKSITSEQIKRSLLKSDVKILSMEFEMQMTDQLLRNLASSLNKDFKEVVMEKPNDLDLDNLNHNNLFYIDSILEVEEIKKIIVDFVNEHEGKIVITLDHTLLIKGRTDVEKTIIDNLMKVLVELKIAFAAIEREVSFIILSQLNRDIESNDRLANPLFHFPKKSDIFAASSVYYSADYVIIVHCPAKLSGLGSYYGQPNKENPRGYPVKIGNNYAVYLHLIKNRFGTLDLIPCIEEYSKSRLIEC